MMMTMMGVLYGLGMLGAALAAFPAAAVSCCSTPGVAPGKAGSPRGARASLDAKLVLAYCVAPALAWIC
jgi:hypothetical protein